MITATVEQGSVFVNSIWSVVATDKTWVFEADLKAKYAEIHSLSGVAVWIDAGPYTLHAEPSRGCTKVEFQGVPTDAQIMAEVSRYSLRVVFYVPDTKAAELVWAGTNP